MRTDGSWRAARKRLTQHEMAGGRRRPPSTKSSARGAAGRPSSAAFDVSALPPYKRASPACVRAPCMLGERGPRFEVARVWAYRARIWWLPPRSTTGRLDEPTLRRAWRGLAAARGAPRAGAWSRHSRAGLVPSRRRPNKRRYPILVGPLPEALPRPRAGSRIAADRLSPRSRIGDRPRPSRRSAKRHRAAPQLTHASTTGRLRPVSAGAVEHELLEHLRVLRLRWWAAASTPREPARLGGPVVGTEASRSPSPPTRPAGCARPSPDSARRERGYRCGAPMSHGRCAAPACTRTARRWGTPAAARTLESCARARADRLWMLLPPGSRRARAARTSGGRSWSRAGGPATARASGRSAPLARSSARAWRRRRRTAALLGVIRERPINVSRPDCPFCSTEPLHVRRRVPISAVSPRRRSRCQRAYRSDRRSCRDAQRFAVERAESSASRPSSPSISQSSSTSSSELPWLSMATR